MGSVSGKVTRILEKANSPLTMEEICIALKGKGLQDNSIRSCVLRMDGKRIDSILVKRESGGVTYLKVAYFLKERKKSFEQMGAV